MKRSTKAVLLSAFVFPGAGHWYLSKKWQAVALISTSVTATYVLLSGVMTQANLIVDKIVSSEVQPEIGALMNLLTESTSANTSSSITIATFSLAIIWVIGVVDAWWAGKSRPSESKLPPLADYL